MTIANTPTPLLTRANLAVEIATLMLGAGAAVEDIEDQAVGLMFVPFEELQKMLKRFSALRQHDAR